MNEFQKTILPKEGYGEIKFGDSSDKVISILGEADEMETIEDVDDFNTVILYYWDRGITVFFEGKDKLALSCIEVEDTGASLFEKEIFDYPEEEAIALMKENGYEVAETEIEETGEKRISYDDALLDFFYLDDELIAVNWGVLINDEGEIEEM